jgi:hypothetical protein
LASDFVPDLDVATLIKGLNKKEEGAKGKLSRDDVTKFGRIKCSLMESTVLFINSGWTRDDLMN